MYEIFHKLEFLLCSGLLHSFGHVLCPTLLLRLANIMKSKHHFLYQNNVSSYTSPLDHYLLFLQKNVPTIKTF